ncbi:MAG: hypothetical protein HYW57_00330 [Ignavibacteriales bacterium]|nr:hypothetical protein [Ignavibacteriales bacterium]
MRLATAFLIVLFTFLPGCGSSKKVTAPKIAVMLMDFEGRAGIDAGTAQIIRDAFAAELQKTGRFSVIDRQATAAIMEEQEFQAAQKGQVASAKLHSLKKMISGSVGKLGEDYVFNIKVTDVESASVDFAIAKMYNGDLEDVIEDFLPELANELLRSLGPH